MADEGVPRLIFDADVAADDHTTSDGSAVLHAVLVPAGNFAAIPGKPTH